MSKIRRLPLKSVHIDSDLQVRVKGTNNATVARYAEKIAAGEKFPAIVVFFDGKRYWLADGFHTVDAHRQLNKRDILCDVHSGSRTDALRFALSANDVHGMPRSTADKKRAIAICINTPELGCQSNKCIAETCKVSQVLVDKVRKELGDTRTIRIGADGKAYGSSRTKIVSDSTLPRMVNRIESWLTTRQERNGGAKRRYDAIRRHITAIRREFAAMTEVAGC